MPVRSFGATDMTRAIAIVALCAGVSVTAQQPATDTLRFEVASIKPAPAEWPRAVGRPAPDRFYVPRTPLRALIRNAYRLADFQLLGGPAWIDTEAWEVTAKADRVPAAGEMRVMLQRLLEERFALKAHHETRDLPIYNLVLARSDGRLGRQMKPPKIDCEPFRTRQRPIADEPLTETGSPVCGTARMLWGAGVTTNFFLDASVSQLALNLQAIAGRIVVDKTGLGGRYDIELTYENPQAVISPGQKLREAPPLPTALQDQLGLKFESSRGPVDVLVIDSVERPTPD
jgi:uncharacterized protein (TIGR03435 family)